MIPLWPSQNKHCPNFRGGEREKNFNFIYGLKLGIYLRFKGANVTPFFFSKDETFACCNKNDIIKKIFTEKFILL